MPILNPSYPGVYIQEIPSGSHTITGVATSTAAFVGVARFGPVNEPVVVQSFAGFEQEFGGLWHQSGMSYAVYHFFLNGGATAVIVRMTPDDGYKGVLYINWSTGDEIPSFQAVTEGSWFDAVDATMDHVPGAPADVFNVRFKQYAEPLGANPNAELLRTEDYPDVSFNSTSPRYIGDILERESQLVRYIGRSTSGTGDTIDSLSSTTRESGSDGDLGSVTVVGSGFEAARKGIYALELADSFNLLCLPPVTRAADGIAWADIPNAVWAQAAAYATRRRAILLVDPPSAWTKANAIANLSDLGSPSPNAALYFPRISMSDPLRTNMPDTFAPSGAVAGVIARMDSIRGIWKAPAGLESVVAGADNPAISLTDAEIGQLNPLGVNVIRTITNVGTVVWGARTLAGADRLSSDWKYLPVRRLALYIEESLYRGTQWAVFELNDASIWAQLRMTVNSFMNTLFNQGAFAGGTASEAYFVICDATTTTQSDINQGVVNIVVGFAPVKPAEFIVITIRQMAGQSTS